MNDEEYLKLLLDHAMVNKVSVEVSLLMRILGKLVNMELLLANRNDDGDSNDQVS